MDYGTSKRIFRAKLPIAVLIGFNPTEPTKLSSLAPPIDTSAIKSGMVLKKITGNVLGVSSQLGFQKAAAADSTTAVSFFIALQDGDSHDVQAAGNLVGLDCSDQFEIQSGYFDQVQVWALDDPLTVGDDGILVKATTGDYIVGYITKLGSSVNNTERVIQYVGKTPSTAAADSNMIQFKTAQSGVKAA